MLHHAGLAVNAQFEASAFFLTAPHNLKVRGTFVTDLFIKVQTEPSGRELRIEFTPNAPPTPLVHSVLGSAQHLAPGESHSLDGVSIAVSGRADHLYVVTPGWAINVTARLLRRSATPGKRQIDLACVPLRDPLAPLPGTGRAVAPHGLIGQSFDGDRVAVDGRKDHYRELWWRQTSFRAWEITTEAQAEGAIEGSGDDYKVTDPFGTDFKYSRFSALEAAPRDVSALSGVKRVAAGDGGANGWRLSRAGSSGDDESLPSVGREEWRVRTFQSFAPAATPPLLGAQL